LDRSWGQTALRRGKAWPIVAGKKGAWKIAIFGLVSGLAE